MLVFWLYDWNRHAYIILQSYNPLDTWSDTVYAVDAVEVIRRPITAQHTVFTCNYHRLQSVQPQAPFCYVSRSSNPDFLPLSLLRMGQLWLQKTTFERTQPSSGHNLQVWSKKKWLSLSMFWLCCNEIVSAIFITQSAKVIEGERIGKPSQDLSMCKLSLFLMLSPVNFGLANNILLTVNTHWN